MEVSFGLTHIAIILSLAFLGGLLLQHFKQPALIGYIIVGALIGPSILGFQANDPTLSWLAELAIIFLMFMLGLELDISRFVRGMRIALWITALQIFAGLAVMLTVSWIFGWPLGLGVLLGFVVALSSTAVAVSMLRDLGETNSSAGRLATAILIAQDVSIVPMLLIVGTFSDGAITVQNATVFGFTLGVIALSIFLIFRITRHPEWVARLEQLLLKGTGQPVVAGMALCFAAAALSGYVGLSTAYGAFAVGLLVGNVGNVGASFRHAIHPIHDFLMMFFFFSIGLLLDISFILKHAVTIFMLIVIVIFLKTAFNVWLLRFLGASKRSAYTLGAVLGQIGEFSFVLIALGLSNGFIDMDGYRFALAIIALSLTLSPVWLRMVRTYLSQHAPVPQST